MSSTATLATPTLGETTTQEHEFASVLYDAYHNHAPLNVSDYSGKVKDLTAAYRVQHELTRLKGEPVAAYKVSLTSEQTQKMFDATEPLYGAQVASRVRQTPLTLSLAELFEPLVEVELNFRVTKPLGRGTTAADVFESTTVAAGLEVPDSRFRNWFPSLPKELVGSDAAVGGYVLYATEHPTAELFSSVDALTKVKAQLWHDGKQVAEGDSTEVLGNPLNSVAWLANALDAQGMGGLKVGQRVSSGTFVLPPKLTAGTWKATYDSGLGDVEVTVKEH